MVKTHLKSEANFKQPHVNVDRDNSIIKNVVIVQEGLDKSNGYFTPEFLSELIEHGNAQSVGLKSRFGHPNMCKESLGSYIGRYKNFRFKGKDVVADLHLAPITEKVQVEGRGISMKEYLLSMAETESDVFGNSIHYVSEVENYAKDINGVDVEVEEYKNLKSFIASDLVDSPCATTDLFKSSEDFGVIGTRFLNEHPQIFEAISKDSSILIGFLKKYTNYLKANNKQVDMNIIEKMTDWFKSKESKKDISLATESGAMITVVTDAEFPMIGDNVNSEDGSPAPDGEHLIPSTNQTIVTESGVITAINDGEEEEAEETQESNESEESNITDSAEMKSFENMFKSLEKSIDTIKDTHSELSDSLKKSNVETEKGFQFLTEKIKEIQENHNTLAKSVKGSPMEDLEEETEDLKTEKKSIVESAREKLNKQK